MSLPFMLTVILLALSSLVYVAHLTSSIVPQDLGPQVILSLLIGPDALRSAELSSISTDNSYSSTELHATNGASHTSSSSTHNVNLSNTVVSGRRQPDVPPTLQTTHPLAARSGNAELRSFIAASSTHNLNSSELSPSSSTTNQRRPIKIVPMPSMPPLTIRHGNLSLTSGVASHIIARAANGSWSPKAAMIVTLPGVDNLMFPRAAPDASQRGRVSNDSRTTEHQYLGFIRMTKTGSSSMLNFLNGATKLQTLDKYLRHDEFRRDVANGPAAAMKTTYLVPPCMFGYHLAPDQVTANKTLPNPGYQCQHLPYHSLVTTFASTLRYYKSPHSIPEPRRVKLDMMTVVRDPVDRYLSFFHYWRSVYPAWNATARPGEREALVSGDFEEFLRLVAEHERRGMNSAFQYEYLSPSVDYSVALVTDRRVLPLLNECFNASVLLLADLYPQFLSVNETLHFLQTSAATTNARNKAGPGRNILARRGLEPVKEFELDAVKKRARKWLERDYRFYDASKSMFLRYLQASTVDPVEVGRCRRSVADEAARLWGVAEYVA